MLSIKEINLLQAQNEGYRTQNKSLQKEINKLQKENEHWQQLYQDEHCELLQVKEEQRLFTLEAKKMIAECSAKLEWYKLTLQEIKKYIAKICEEECGYVPKKRCPDCDCRFGKILNLITKAEKE